MKKKKSDQLLNYFTKHADAFVNHFQQLGNAPSATHIHKIRVDIKKIRTTFRLLEALKPGPRFNVKEQVAIFLPVFEAAGKVREAQVNLSLIGRYEISSSVQAYKKHLEEKEEKGTENLIKVMQAFDFTLFEKNRYITADMIRQSTKDHIIVSAKRILFKKTKKIMKLSGHAGTKSHLIRKHLKAMYAMASIIHMINGRKKYQKLAAGIRKAESAIGEWHNTQVLILSLQKFTHKHPSIVLEGLIDVLEKQNEAAVHATRKKLEKIT